MARIFAATALVDEVESKTPALTTVMDTIWLFNIAMENPLIFNR